MPPLGLTRGENTELLAMKRRRGQHAVQHMPMVYFRRHVQLSSASDHGHLDPSLQSRHLSFPAPAMPGTAARASMREVRLDILPGVVRRAFKMIWPTDGRLALGTVNPVRRLGKHEVCNPAHHRTCQGIRLRDEIQQLLASTPPSPLDTMLSVELATGSRGD